VREGLARARRTDQEHALGDSPAQSLEFLGILEELHNLLKLGLRVLQPGDLIERRALLRLVVTFGRTLDETAEDPAVELVSSSPHHQVEQAEDEEHRQEHHDPGKAAGRVGRIPFDLDDLGLLPSPGAGQLLAERLDQFLGGNIHAEFLYERGRPG